MRRFDGQLCLNARVIRPGAINTGDAVSLVWDEDALGAAGAAPKPNR